MGGAPISDEVRRSISEVWYSSTSGGKKDIPGKELINKAKPYLRKQGLLPPKSDSSYYTVFSQMKNLPLDKRRLIDKFNRSWNLDVLDDEDCFLPNDTIPSVLALWRYCKNLGPELTIRQAKWASRLCYLLKDLDIAEQWIQVTRYSREEELSLLSGTPMRIDQLNSLLIMEPWETTTLSETDVKFKANRRLSNHFFTPIGRDGGIEEEYFYAFADIAQSFIEMRENNELPENHERINELQSVISDLPTPRYYFPDLESRLVYLRHLAKLSSLPYWKSAEPEEIHILIVELRQWIISGMKGKYEEDKNPKYSSILGTQIHRGPYGSFPLDIYLRAGFSLDEDTKELEGELRKIHPDWFE